MNVEPSGKGDHLVLNRSRFLSSPSDFIDSSTSLLSLTPTTQTSRCPPGRPIDHTRLLHPLSHPHLRSASPRTKRRWSPESLLDFEGMLSARKAVPRESSFSLRRESSTEAGMAGGVSLKDTTLLHSEFLLDRPPSIYTPDQSIEPYSLKYLFLANPDASTPSASTPPPESAVATRASSPSSYFTQGHSQSSSRYPSSINSPKKPSNQPNSNPLSILHHRSTLFLLLSPSSPTSLRQIPSLSRSVSTPVPLHLQGIPRRILGICIRRLHLRPSYPPEQDRVVDSRSLGPSQRFRLPRVAHSSISKQPRS